jgi:hypothetical protein
MSDSALKLRLRLRLLLKFRRYSRSRRCSVVKRLTGAMLLVRRYCDAAVLRTAVWRKRRFGAAEKLVRRELRWPRLTAGTSVLRTAVWRKAYCGYSGTSELRCCSAIAALASGPHPCSFSRSLCESRPAADGSAICGHQSRRLRWRRRFRAADFGAASVSGGSWRKRGAQTIMGGGVGGAGWRRSATCSWLDPGRPKLAIGGEHKAGGIGRAALGGLPRNGGAIWPKMDVGPGPRWPELEGAERAHWRKLLSGELHRIGEVGGDMPWRYGGRFRRKLVGRAELHRNLRQAFTAI